jgi:hypothetical protein
MLQKKNPRFHDQNVPYMQKKTETHMRNSVLYYVTRGLSYRVLTMVSLLETDLWYNICNRWRRMYVMITSYYHRSSL